MDLWTTEQTKASFLGLTIHWIQIDKDTKKWKLHSQVIAFWGYSGAHSGNNIAWNFVSLCERAGIITSTSSKLLCLTADNASSNDKAANAIEMILHHCHVYSFNPDSNHLTCLTHVINLTISSVLAVIIKIANVNTTTTIWEFDPTLPQNCILDDTLDIVSTIQTLTIKIQCSGQQIEYLKTLQVKCGINPPLSIPLHSNVRWGTADEILARAYELCQVCSHLVPVLQHVYSSFISLSICSLTLRMSYMELSQPSVMTIKSNASPGQGFRCHQRTGKVSTTCKR